MAYNNLDQTSTTENLGQKYSPKEGLARVIKLILTPSTFQFATQTLAEDDDNWQNAIEAVADRIYPLPFVYSNEDNSEEPTKEEFPGGDSLGVRAGRYAERMKVHVSVGDMRKLASFNNQVWRAFEVDANGNICGTSPDDIVFKGFEVSDFEVEKMNRTVGDVNRLVPIYIKYREPDEWTTKGVVVRPLHLETVADRWDPRDIDGLTDIELTVNTSTATNINVTATAYLKGEPIAGLDQVADWILTTGQTITAVTDNADGTYDLTGVGLVTGTLNLAASSVLSLDGYESTGAQTVTIV